MGRARNLARMLSRWLCASDGSALLELAVCLPLLVVFVVGIFDFSGAFNQKQKIEQAAQEGAIVAGAQPTSDIETGALDPQSLHPVVTAIFNSLAANGVLPQANLGTCKLPPPVPTNAGLTWTYSISGCSSYPADTNPGCMSDPADKLWIAINRGWVPTGAISPVPVGTSVTVSYNYHWRFNSAIQLIVPGAAYSAKTCISETSTVHNQM